MIIFSEMKQVITIITLALIFLGCGKPNRIDASRIIGVWDERYDDPFFVMDGYSQYTFNQDGTFSHKVYDALSNTEIVNKYTYIIRANVITLNLGTAENPKEVKYIIKKLEKKEMQWQKEGTSYRPGSYGTDFKRLVRMK